MHTVLLQRWHQRCGNYEPDIREYTTIHQEELLMVQNYNNRLSEN